MSTRQSFHNDLKELKESILAMGEVVEKAIEGAVKALVQQDIKLAEEIMQGDDIIDKMTKDIEELCMKLIATQQPMAKDLRRISAGYRIIIDLERMGDHAYNIAKIAIRLSDEKFIKPLIDIPKMAILSQKMVSNVLAAYVENDEGLALEVCKADDEIDSLYKNIYNELLDKMNEDKNTNTQATSLLFVSHYLERIADHVTNISESIIYLNTGQREELNC